MNLPEVSQLLLSEKKVIASFHPFKDLNPIAAIGSIAKDESNPPSLINVTNLLYRVTQFMANGATKICLLFSISKLPCTLQLDRAM